MGPFQKIVITIVVIGLLVCFLLIGYSLHNTKKNQSWPPTVSQCPDYWVDLSGNSDICLNIKDLGTCNAGLNKGLEGKHTEMDFSDSTYQGSNGNCAKFQWANQCGVSWDGITYGYGSQNPCDAAAAANSTTS